VHPVQYDHMNYPAPQAPQPIYQVMEPHAAPQEDSQAPHDSSRPPKSTRKPVAFSTVRDGKHALGVRKSRGPERPRRHNRVEVNSMSSSSSGHREGVSFPSLIVVPQTLSRDSIPAVHKVYRPFCISKCDQPDICRSRIF
jgi:hypothetical protein